MPIQIPVTQVGLEASIQAAAQSAGRNLKIDLGSASKSIGSLSQPLGRITGQADDFTKSMEAANARVLAFGASVGVLSAVTAGFKQMINVTIQVEKSLADINSVLGASSGQLNKFKNDIFSIAKETGNSFATVSEAALELSRQGLKSDEVLRRLKDSMILARLSGLDAGSAVEGLTAAVNSFSKTGVTTSEVLNKLSNTAAKFAISERDLIQGFQRSASVAQQAGVSLDELGGIITAVQQKTARGGAVIGNAFKTIFTRIQRPESLQALQDVGAAVTDAQGGILPATKLIENLAEKINGLNDIQRANITEKIGGGFQIGPLLAALDDLSSKTSTFQGATEAMANAGSEAYGRNTALNQTLAAAINSTTVSMQQLANTLGELGVTDNLKNLLSYFSSFTDSVQNLLEGDTLGSDFAKGIVKGIGGVLSGPGLLIFGAIIAKLTFNFIKFGNEALKTFFNIGNSAKELNAVQTTITNTLLNNKNIQSQILALEGNRVAQAKFFSTALNTQLATMEKMRSIAASIAPAVVAGTSPRSRRAADGYMPSVMAESSDIKRGVGGAKPSDRPVVIPNFNFGSGKKGTMVANSGEYLVPNFGGGSGSAIFNREMVGRMGLPSNAQKINSAGGFVPNFVRDLFVDKFGLSRSTVQREWNSFKESYAGNDAPSAAEAYSSNQKVTDAFVSWRNSPQRRNIKVGENEQRLLSKAESVSGKARYAFIYNSNKNQSNNLPYKTEKGRSGVFKAIGVAVEPEDYLYDEVRSGLINSAKNYAKQLNIDPDLVNDDKFSNIVGQSLNRGSVEGALGTVFESAFNGAIQSLPGSQVAGFDLSQQSVVNLKKVFNKIGKNPKSELSSALDSSILAGDFKNALNISNQKSFLKKIDNFEGQVPSAISKKLSETSNNKANGYIPNFANALTEAISREIGAGVDPSQVYIDQNSSLKNAGNPMGLMVANRRDEPQGGFQGIARARKEGANAQFYGAANGFVPNFAPQLGQVGRVDLGRTQISDQKIADFNKSLKQISDQLRKGSISFADASSQVNQLAKSSGSTKAQITRLGTSGQGLIAAYNNELEARNKKAQELKQQRATDRSSASAPAKQSRDILGPVFALQAAFSALSAATSDATGQVGKYTNVVSEGLSSGTTAVFALQGLGTVLPKFASFLGPAGIAVGALTAAYQIGTGLYYENSDANKLAAENTAKLAEAARYAAIKLEELDPVVKQQVDQKTKDLLYNFRNYQIGNEGQFQERGTTDKLLGQQISLVQLSEEDEKNLQDSIRYAIANGASDAEIGKILNDGVTQGTDLTRNLFNEVNMLTKESASKVQATLMELARNPELKKLISELKLASEGSYAPIATKLGLSQDQAKNLLEPQSAQADKVNEQRAIALLMKNSGGKINKTAATELVKDFREAQGSKSQNSEQETAQAVAALNIEYNKLLSTLQGQIQYEKTINDLTDQSLSKKADLRKIAENLTLTDIERQRAIEDANTANEKSVDIIKNQITASEGLKGSLSEVFKTPGLKIEDFDKAFKTIQDKVNEFQVQFANAFETGNLSEIDRLTKSINDSLGEQIKNQQLGNAAVFEYVKSLYNGNKLLESRYKINFNNVTIDRTVADIEKNRVDNLSRQNQLIESSINLKQQSRQLDIAAYSEEEFAARKRVTALGQTKLGETSLQNLRREAEAARIQREILTPTDQSRAISEKKETAFQTAKSLVSGQLLEGADPSQIGQIKTDLEKITNFDQLRVKYSGDLKGNLDLIEEIYKKEIDALEKNNEASKEGVSLAEQRLALIQRGAAGGIESGLGKLKDENEMFAFDLGERIPQLFADNMASAMEAVIMQGESLGDSLRSAASSFLNEITKANLKNLAGGITGSIGSGIGTLFKANGGKITGGSGNKDDVPAMLMGGEYVINKKSVSKYGSTFMESLNNGTLQGFAKGGSVIRGRGINSDVISNTDPGFQTGEGGFQMPGYYGQGTISGKKNLLAFARQGYTSGANDIISSGNNSSYIDLEGESVRLTNFGRRNGPMADAIRESKGQAFDLYKQQLAAEKQAREEEKARKEAFRNSIKMALISTAVGVVGKAATSGFQAGATSAGQDATIGERFGAGFKGIFSGGDIGEGVQSGGIKNLFSGNFALSQISSTQELSSYLNTNPNSDFAKQLRLNSPDMFNNGKFIERALPFDSNYSLFNGSSFDLPDGKETFGSPMDSSLLPPKTFKNATGGLIPSAGGIDTVPAMLSGGEFIMNAAATQRIGPSNLNAMNSGSSNTDSKDLNDKLISKLDELITASKESSKGVTVNVTSDGRGNTQESTEGQSSSDQDKNLSRKIKAAVVSVLQEEKRLGGVLRRR